MKVVTLVNSNSAFIPVVDNELIVSHLNPTYSLMPCGGTGCHVETTFHRGVIPSAFPLTD